ncbi:MAG: hypothetical protein ABGX27_02750 [Desulfurobacteriaceae bacterium]
MKKLIFLVIVLFLVGISIYGFLTAPQKVEKIKLEIENGNGTWELQISQYVFPLVRPGETVDIEELEYLKRTIDSLPWVKDNKIFFNAGTLIIKVKEEKVAFSLFYNGYTYFLNDEGFVLDKKEGFVPQKPIYYYKGKSSPFVLVNSFFKLKNLIKMEISLLEERLKETKIYLLNPEIILTDIGINLVFPKTKTIIYLDNSGNSWNNFLRFDRIAKGLIPGIYDFRFSNLLIRGRNQCLNKKS